MKVLITGKRDKLWKGVGAACSRQRGFQATVMPIGSPVIERVRGRTLDAVLYTISREEEIEPLRWILQINPALPVVALLPRKDEELRKLVLAEGVDQAVALSSLNPKAVQEKLVGAGLLEMGSRVVSSSVRQQISEDLHAIRSTLTAILGTAEMALKRSQPMTHTRKHIKEIPREVMEIEKVLRRIHRTIKTNPATESKAAKQADA
jgi:hypothetical protein